MAPDVRPLPEPFSDLPFGLTADSPWALVAMAWVALVVVSSILEVVGYLRLDERVFRLGPVILRERFELPRPSAIMAIGQVLETGTAKFKLVAHDTLLVRQKLSFAGHQSRSSLKLCLRFQGNGADLEGRLSLSTVLVLPIILGVFAEFWTEAARRSPKPSSMLLGLLVGMLLVTVMAFVTVWGERRAARGMVGELEERMSGRRGSG